MKSASVKKAAGKKATVKKAPAKKAPAKIPVVQNAPKKIHAKRAPFTLTPLERVVQTALADPGFVILLFKNPDAALAGKKIRLTNAQRNTLLQWLETANASRTTAAVSSVGRTIPVWPGDIA